MTWESTICINSHNTNSSLIILGQDFSHDSENKVDKDDDNDYYGSIRDQQHYYGPA